MIRHLLLIKFKAHVNLAAQVRLWRLFAALPNKIDGVVAVEWGENDSPEQLNKGYTHCVNMLFRDEQAREYYLPHPEHEALKEVFVPMLEDIIVVDYSVRN